MAHHDPRLEGAPNFRDLGAQLDYGTTRLRPGRIFRSEALTRLTDADLSLVRTLDIKLLFDLRAPDERERDSNRWPAGLAVETVAGLKSDELAAVRFSGWRQRIHDPGFDGHAIRQWIMGAYAEMPRLFADTLASAFDRLAAPQSPVTLLHCTAGKDRTGFVCAMLLLALGVSRQRVFDDYLLTRRRRLPMDLLQTLLGDELQTLPPSKVAALVVMADVAPAYLETALDSIENEFGGVDAYLLRTCGLTRSKRDALQSQLLF
jgi:protein-tyrosine phosphatase